MTSTVALNNVTLTSAFSGNQSAAIGVGHGNLVALINYTQDTETSMQLQLEISPNTARDSSQVWYLPITSDGTAASQILTTTSGGLFRLHISEIVVGGEELGWLVSGERSIRISAQATTPGSTPGTVTVTLVGNVEYPADTTPATALPTA